MRISVSNPEAVAREAFWLAWSACGSPAGMGFLRDNPGATRDQVWANARDKADYPGGAAIPGFADKPGEVYGDYVFGRMMKLGLKWDADSVEFTDSAPRPDYQSWCRKYPTTEALVRAAIESLAVTS